MTVSLELGHAFGCKANLVGWVGCAVKGQQVRVNQAHSQPQDTGLCCARSRLLLTFSRLGLQANLIMGGGPHMRTWAKK